MRSLLSNQERYFQTSSLNSYFLKFINKFRLLSGSFMKYLISQCEESSTWTDTFFFCTSRKFTASIEFTLSIFSQPVFIDTRHIHLSDFFFECHSRKKIFHSIIN